MSDISGSSEYTVGIDPLTLELSVSLVLEGEFVRDGMVLQVPSWVPGDYDFEPYGRDVFEVTVIEPAGVEIKRDGWNGYKLQGDPGGKVHLKYRAAAYEPDLGDAMGLVDSNYAVLMGTRYLFTEEFVGECSVRYIPPKGWKIHHPSGAQNDGNNRWTYPSFEILLDTPVCIGDLTILKRDIRNVPFYFVFVDQGVGFNQRVEEFVNTLEDAVKHIHDVFQVFPFGDYSFVLSLNPQADWGLEHLTSNMSGIGPNVFVDQDQFSNGIRVCAHELFHAWNVRRLRPAPLGQLRHQLACGCFTEGLWVAEGFTRYYEYLISTRAKAYTPDQFFSAVLGYFTHLSQQPAYDRVTATDASYASYLNHAKYPGRVNNAIDYYDKGMLIAFAIDGMLRRDGSSLDHAFKGFWEAFYVDQGGGDTLPPDYVGYSTQDVIDYFNTYKKGLGTTVGAWATEPAGLDTPGDLAALGLKPIWQDTHQVGIFFLNQGAPTIYGVADNMPAACGLAPGDVITHIGGFTYSWEALSWAAAQADTLSLTVTRGHRVLNFQMTPQPAKKISGLIWVGSPDQAELISKWIGQDFAPHDGQVFPVDFYENFHGIEAMI